MRTATTARVSHLLSTSDVSGCRRSFSSVRRVVVTGVGGVTPLAGSAGASWSRLLAKKSAVRGIFHDMDPSDAEGRDIYEKLPSKVAARIPLQEFEALKSRHLVASDFRVMSKAMALGVLAAEEALSDSDWRPTHLPSLERTGVAVGNAMVDLDYIATSHELIRTKSVNKLSPYFVPRILPNLAPGHISIRHGFMGPNHSVSTACSTGSHAIGDAFNFIKMGAADVMVAGGVDTCINPLSMAGFCRARALATKYNDDPQAASRPFDKHRDGFVMGEGGVVLVVEELRHALERKAKIYCEILGYGLSGDGHHITAGRSDGRGAYLAMRGSLKYFRDSPAFCPDLAHELVCINAHATSTPLGDLAELAAIRTLLKDIQDTDWIHLPGDGRVPVVSHKGNMGHLIGACGSAETAFVALALSEGKIPGNVNLDALDENIQTDNLTFPSEVTVLTRSSGSRKLILKNSFGFGGTNVSLLLGEYVP